LPLDRCFVYKFICDVRILGPQLVKSA
jgi:hypothetical protein